MATVSSTVLLVDDDRIEADLFVRAFRKSGFKQPVQVQTSGEQAKRYLGGEGEFNDRARFPVPSLIVLDHRMPGDCGWSVLEWMRVHPALNDVPVVVFSGSGSATDQARASELGASYQVKPHTSEEYEAVVRRMGEFWLTRISSQQTQ
jgi:CheY-like chemotaxis protein